MDSQILELESEKIAPTNTNPNKTIHTNGHAETKAPQLGRAKKLPRELTWFACQAVRLSADGKTIELRSFPFFALSLEHARRELLEMQKAGHQQPYTDIYQFAALNQAAGKMAKCKLEANKINILTGARK